MVPIFIVLLLLTVMGGLYNYKYLLAIVGLIIVIKKVVDTKWSVPLLPPPTHPNNIFYHWVYWLNGTVQFI